MAKVTQKLLNAYNQYNQAKLNLAKIKPVVDSYIQDWFNETQPTVDGVLLNPADIYDIPMELFSDFLEFTQTQQKIHFPNVNLEPGMDILLVAESDLRNAKFAVLKAGEYIYKKVGLSYSQISKANESIINQMFNLICELIEIQNTKELICLI